MPLVKAHGTARELGQIMVVETARPSKLPSGMQADEQAEASTERTPTGQWVRGCSTAQSKGGKAHKGKTVLSHRLGLDTLTAKEDFKPHLAAARAFHKRVCSDLARSVGAGECPPIVASIVMGAAMQTAAAAYLFEQAARDGDVKTFAAASTLSNSARANLLGAWEVCAKHGSLKGESKADADLEAFLRGEKD